MTHYLPNLLALLSAICLIGGLYQLRSHKPAARHWLLAAFLAFWFGLFFYVLNI